MSSSRRTAAPRQQRQPKRKRRNVLSTVLLIVGVALLVTAGVLYARAQAEYAANAANNEKLAAYATVSDDPAESGCPVSVDWDGLRAVNDDITGWLYIPGTHVDYPVYQGDANNEYLRTTATGEYSVGGQIFMDCDNARPGLVDRQTIIYGHHLNDGSMFADIDEFANQDGLNSFSSIWYVTPDAAYELEPLLFYKAAATEAEARSIAFASDDDFHTYLTGLLARASASATDADSAVNSVTKVLTLCTCDYENNFGKGNGRGLLVCALKSEIHPNQNSES